MPFVSLFIPIIIASEPLSSGYFVFAHVSIFRDATALSNEETLGILHLLSLLGEFHYNLGRRDVCTWNPSSSKGLSWFNLCLIMEGEKSQEEVKFFVWQVLRERLNTLDRVLRRVPNLMGL